VRRLIPNHRPDRGRPVYDLRDVIPDEAFTDTIHADFDAMEPTSIWVGRCVHDLLSEHPAPERLRAGEAAAGERPVIRGAGIPR
jgi:hypothetical protein